MPISPACLPSELHYIIPLAEQHGSEARISFFDRELQRHVVYAEKLSEDDLAPLRELYAEIRDKGHADLINRWHQTRNRETCPPETSFPIYGLLCLFSQLRELDVAPFNDGAVGPQKKVEQLDWNKLPPNLRYLAGSAEVYGDIQFEWAIYKFFREQMTAYEQAELRALKQRYERDGEAINRWVDDLGITKHREAALVYFLGSLLAIGNDEGLL